MQCPLLIRRAGASAVYDGNAPMVTPPLDALLADHGIPEGYLLEMTVVAVAMRPRGCYQSGNFVDQFTGCSVSPSLVGIQSLKDSMLRDSTG